MGLLHDLPKDHPDRYRPLAGARYRWRKGRTWKKVGDKSAIAGKTFNELGLAWTANDVFTFDATTGTKTGIKDGEGVVVMVGDFVFFSYGIPQVGVRAEIVINGGVVWALTPGHNPPRCELSRLEEYVGYFHIDQPS